LNLDALCTGLDALKNLVTFKDKLALPLFFSNSRPEMNNVESTVVDFLECFRDSKSQNFPRGGMGPSP
jgi:hypothetical protein